MTINRIRTLIQEDFDAVNTLITNSIQSQIGLIDDLSKHIIQSGGKRLRPMLVLLASKACGYTGNAHIQLAAMIEFLHTATLLHDDVVDESTLRRGQPTANNIWGSKSSILVGDYLFTQSFQLLVDVGNFEVIKLITDTSCKITTGEIKQLINRNNPSLTMEDYFEVICAKTAYLFASATCIGGQITQSDTKVQDSLYAYGLHLGNAFQLIDDALDYCSDAKTLGKNIGDDLIDGKATLPLIHALKHGTDLQQQQIMDGIKKGSLDNLPEILKTIEETKAIEFTRQVAAEEIDKALTALVVLPNSEYKNALIDIAQFALEREY